MALRQLLAAPMLVLAAASAAAGDLRQTTAPTHDDPKTTVAYGVLLARRAVVEAELKNMRAMYKKRYKAVENRRFELTALGREIEKMVAKNKSNLSKLSAAYGALILRKVALEVELKDLLDTYTPKHPEVKLKRDDLRALEHEIEYTFQ